MTDQSTPAEHVAKALELDPHALAALTPALTRTIRFLDRHGTLTEGQTRPSDVVQDYLLRQLTQMRQVEKSLECNPRTKGKTTGGNKKPVLNAEAYHGRAVVNEALSQRKKQNRKKRASVRGRAKGLDGLAGPTPTSSKIAVLNEQVAAILRAEQELAEDERDLLHRGMERTASWAEIGKTYGLSAAAARMKYTRLLGRLMALAQITEAV